MNATMRAARIHEWKQAPAVEDVPVPVAGPGEALVLVGVAAVAHLDVTMAGGEFGIKPTLPYAGGVEGGRTVSIGYVTGDNVRMGLSNWLLDDVALLPVNMIRHERDARALLPELAAMLAAGELTLANESFGLEDTGQALELLREGRVRGRAVVRPS